MSDKTEDFNFNTRDFRIEPQTDEDKKVLELSDALRDAMHNGNCNVVDIFLREGIRVQGSNFETFSFACESGYIDIVKVVLKHVGEYVIHEKQGNGETLLIFCMKKKYYEIVEYLLDIDASPVEKTAEGHRIIDLVDPTGIVRRIAKKMFEKGFSVYDSKPMTNEGKYRHDETEHTDDANRNVSTIETDKAE